jgi:hydrogenase maturation protease
MAAERAQHILVIGIGNAESGDDGVGLAVAERVSGLGLSKVDVAKHCGDACALMEAWEGYGNVILVDATRSGAMAGTVRSFDPRAMPPTGCAFGMSTHGFGVAWTLEFARALNRLPARCRVFAVEGERFDQRTGLSPAVKSALDEVLEQITAQIARMRATIGTERDE